MPSGHGATGSPQANPATVMLGPPFLTDTSAATSSSGWPQHRRSPGRTPWVVYATGAIVGEHAGTQQGTGHAAHLHLRRRDGRLHPARGRHRAAPRPPRRLPGGDGMRRARRPARRAGGGAGLLLAVLRGDVLRRGLRRRGPLLPLRRRRLRRRRSGAPGRCPPSWRAGSSPGSSARSSSPTPWTCGRPTCSPPPSWRRPRWPPCPLLVLLGVRLPTPTASEGPAAARSAPSLRQPRFVAAVVCGVVSYLVMNFLMTAAPLAMHMCGLSQEASDLGLQWHVIAMYGPSFFTGRLIARFGAPRVVDGRAGPDRRFRRGRAGGRGRRALLADPDPARLGVELRLRGRLGPGARVSPARGEDAGAVAQRLRRVRDHGLRVLLVRGPADVLRVGHDPLGCRTSPSR